MIDSKCFESDWIRRQAGEIGCRNAVMLEKAIVALQLLGHLAESGLPFQFKGGTSLLLRLDPIRRLSIDIDIVCQAAPQELAKILDGVGIAPPFTRYVHNERRDKDLPPKKHYNLYYPSVIEPKEDHILLDVMFDTVAPNCTSVPITTGFIEPLRAIQVMVPTIESLLGDKLTAFAPTTIGILYHEDRKTDIVKQLFDVAALFDAASDIQLAAEAYTEIHAKQLLYRQKSYSLEETLQDTINAAYEITQRELKGGNDSVNGKMLAIGVKSLQNHLVNVPFNIDRARIAAGKAACLAASMMRKRQDIMFGAVRFDKANVAALKERQIAEPWLPLNRMRGANPEAFHYWLKTQEILDNK